MTRPLRVEWVGTYERDYPRTRVLVEGLRAHGVEVTEHHRPVWERTRHKAGGFLSPRGLAGAGLVSETRAVSRGPRPRRRPEAPPAGG